MILFYKSAELRDICLDSRKMKKRYGKICAKKIIQRRDELLASPNLAEMRNIGGRCHELKGKRAGQFAVDLEHPLRLIFECAENPAPRKTDGGLDWGNIESIRILKIEDYHG